jgi:hypothetical protein
VHHAKGQRVNWQNGAETIQDVFEEKCLYPSVNESLSATLLGANVRRSPVGFRRDFALGTDLPRRSAGQLGPDLLAEGQMRVTAALRFSAPSTGPLAL